MIFTKLNKNATTGLLLIEFSELELHPVLEKFYNNCKEEGVLTRRSSHIQHTQMNFHLVQVQDKMEISNVTLKNTVQNFSFVLTVYYVNSEEEEEKREKRPPFQRSLLLREGLDMKFFMDYQFQNTQSEQESLIALCELSATIINSQFEKQISFYDQNTTGVRIKHESEAEKCWMNILFQIPGLGQQKCKLIAEKYPNYQTLLLDYLGSRQLPKMLVKSGVKEIKLGEAMANRIYRALFSENCHENILVRKY